MVDPNDLVFRLGLISHPLIGVPMSEAERRDVIAAAKWIRDHAPAVHCVRCRRRMDGPVPSAPARTSDPDTAHQAADHVSSLDVRRFSSRSREGKLLAAIADQPDTAIAATVRVFGEYVTPVHFDAARRRISDLVAAGYVEDSGKRTFNEGSNTPSIIWTVTDEGLAALQRLENTGWSR